MKSVKRQSQVSQAPLSPVAGSKGGANRMEQLKIEREEKMKKLQEKMKAIESSKGSQRKQIGKNDPKSPVSDAAQDQTQIQGLHKRDSNAMQSSVNDKSTTDSIELIEDQPFKNSAQRAKSTANPRSRNPKSAQYSTGVYCTSKEKNRQEFFKQVDKFDRKKSMRMNCTINQDAASTLVNNYMFDQATMDKLLGRNDQSQKTFSPNQKRVSNITQNSPYSPYSPQFQKRKTRRNIQLNENFQSGSQVISRIKLDLMTRVNKKNEHLMTLQGVQQGLKKQLEKQMTCLSQERQGSKSFERHKTQTFRRQETKSFGRQGNKSFGRQETNYHHHFEDMTQMYKNQKQKRIRLQARRYQGILGNQLTKKVDDQKVVMFIKSIANGKRQLSLEEIQMLGENYKKAYIQQKVKEDDGVNHYVNKNKLNLTLAQGILAIQKKQISQPVKTWNAKIDHLNQTIVNKAEELEVYRPKKTIKSPGPYSRCHKCH